MNPAQSGCLRLIAHSRRFAKLIEQASGDDTEASEQAILSQLRRDIEKFCNYLVPGSMDELVGRAERVLQQQMQDGGVSEKAAAALTRALDRLHGIMDRIIVNVPLKVDIKEIIPECFPGRA